MAAVAPMAFERMPQTLLFGNDPLEPIPNFILREVKDNEILWLQQQQRK
jgi:hypothetical protein